MLSSNPVRLITAALVIATFLLGLAVPAPAAPPAKPDRTSLTYTRAKDPARTIVTESGSWLATFTDGTRSVVVAGPERVLSEVGVAAVVRSSTWVRLLPDPFAGTVDRAWLAAARADRSPDLLATSLEYVAGSPTARDGSGLLVSSDASYGPLLADGTREEGSDWNDYQGVVATYGSRTDAPEPRQLGSLDCSGFMRMLWGVRNHVPLTLDPNGTHLPRRAVQQLASAPGRVVIPNRGSKVEDLSRLQPGDLVFFDASDDDGTDIDHVGMYLGRDDAGAHRFVSSRKAIDGPTMGDFRGRSTLDGTGLYATAFRATRRL